MENVTAPKEYPEWRTNSFDRAEDAAYTFGSHLIKYCRDEIIEKLPGDISEDQKEKIKDAIHVSLHNVMDLLEGFWKLKSGEKYSIEYALQVVVRDNDRREVERIEISPCKLDLPIGFWKWAEDGEFR